MTSRASRRRATCVVLATLGPLLVAAAFPGDPPPAPAAGAPAPPAAPAPAKIDGASAAEWSQRLASDVLDDRRKAAYALWRLGGAASVAAPALAKALTDADAYVRDTSFRAIERLGAAAKPVVASVAALLSSNREEVRQGAASLLVKLGPLSADAVPALTAALRSDDAKVRELAAAALGNAGTAAAPAWDALHDVASDDLPEVVSQAAGALAKIDLERAISDPRHEVTVEAFAQMGAAPGRFSPSLLDAILSRLGDPSNDVRAGAANGIGTALLRTDAATWRPRVAGPLLDRARREAAEPVLCQVAYALGRVPDASAESVPLLIEWTKSGDGDLRRWTASALSELGERARPALPRLIALLADRDENVAGAAAGAAASVGRGDPAVAPALVKALSDVRPHVAMSAVYAIRSADPSVASVSTPALVDLATNPKAVWWLRGAVAEALVWIALAEPARASIVKRLQGAAAAESAPPPKLLFAIACLTDPPSPAAIDRLVAAALGDDAAARSSANDAFAQEAGPVAGRAWKAGVVARLAEMLNDASAVRRLRAAEALKWFHATATSALPALTRVAAGDADEGVRKAAAESISWIRPSPHKQ